MKLVQLVYSGLGGLASVAFSLVQGDAARRAEHALLFFGVEPCRPEYGARADALGAAWHAVQKRPGLDLASWGAVLGWVRRQRADAVIVHVGSLVVPALALRAAGTRVLFVDHQSDAAKSRQDHAWLGVAMTAADRVVYLTEEAAALGVRRWPQGRRRAVVIPNGIDLERFAPGPARAPPAVPLLCMAARFTVTKEHAVLVRAVHELVRRRGHALRLRLLGDGPTFAAVQALVRELDLGTTVELPGAVDEVALAAALRETDVYVQASLTESMSTSILQAMASGVAVVGSDSAGIRGLIEPGVSGLLVPPSDPARLADALELLVVDPALRAALGAAGRRQAEAHHSQARMFDGYWALLAPGTPGAARGG